MLSGAVRPGRSPIRTATQSAHSAAATASPTATRPWRTTTNGAIRQPSARSSGNTPARTGRAWVCTARADRPSAMTNTTSCPPACGASELLDLLPLAVVGAEVVVVGGLVVPVAEQPAHADDCAAVVAVPHGSTLLMPMMTRLHTRRVGQVIRNT